MPSFMVEGKTPADRYYRPELDVVRCLAFILVFLNHTLPTGSDPRIGEMLGSAAPIFYALARSCAFGLSLFFTLSAFLICELLLRERKAVGTVAVKQFYIRRILRIWPLYYLALALGAVIAFLPGGNTSNLIRLGWFAIFMGSWVDVLHGWFTNPAAPLWSVSVEEQFYLIAPWIVKYLPRRLLFGFCFLLLLASNGELYYLGRVATVESSIWPNAVVQFECFAAGILLSLVLRGRLPGISFWQRLMLLAGSASCWFYATFGLRAFFLRDNNPGSWSLIGGYALAALGSVLLLIAFLNVDPKLLPGWAIYLGRISYGLYVYHEFAIYLTNHFLIGHLTSIASSTLLLKAGAEFGLTFLMAALSYRYFETPFLKMKRRHAIIESQPVGMLVDRSR
jgi:peptidoglycan/LPS O-acetylase OafA/YrhL